MVCRSPFLDWLVPGALALGSLLAASWLQLRPQAGGPLALVFPPWWSATQAVLAAAPAGAVIRFGAWPSIVIIQPAGLPLAPTGAWLVLDPRRLGGCAPLSPEIPHGDTP